MKKLILIITIFLSYKFVAQTYTVGSGNALDFSSNIGSSNHVDLGGLTAINNADFSFECWMKVSSVVDDPAFFSNKNWVSGSNTGLVFDVQDNGTNMKFNFKDPTHSRKDLTVPVNVHRRDWFHFAGTYKKNGYFKVYINGVAKDSLDVSTLTGSFLTSYTYKLGQDGTGNYFYSGSYIRYSGKMDEVRIWTSVRTQQEIRDNMCRKLTGTETNLYAYYNCDVISGTVLPDLSPSANTGTLVSCVPAIWCNSGASIGNFSSNKYSATFGTSTVQISNPAYGDFTVKNISSTAGIHLYRVTAIPNSTLSLNNLSSNANYYGVFPTDTSNAISYDVEYNYTNFATAMSGESNLKLFNRINNEGKFWSEYFALQNTVNHTMTKSLLNKRKEFILGTKMGVSCNAPTNINLVSYTPSSATVGWTTGGATKWNIQWGLQGFPLGTGTTTLNATTNPKTFSGLSSSTFYDMYVQDTCTGTGKSYWVGPFVFSGTICAIPSALSATNITSSSALLNWNGGSVSNFEIEWGLPGFVLGAGIPVSCSSNSYSLTGLGANTAYSYYVRSVCGASNTSLFSGPYSFTTNSLSATGINVNTISDIVSIYPNPTNGTFNITLNQKADHAIIIVMDVLGNIVEEVKIEEGNTIHETVHLKGSAKGIYFVQIKNANSTAVKKIIFN